MDLPKRLVIDRFEGEIALCQNREREIFQIEKSLIENGKEGDIIELSEGIYYPNKEATAERRSRLQERFNRLKNRRQ